MGKEFTEQFKREFVNGLLNAIKNMDKGMINKYISDEAEKIKVYPNEVAIWMGIYRIAFRV